MKLHDLCCFRSGGALWGLRYTIGLHPDLVKHYDRGVKFHKLFSAFIKNALDPAKKEKTVATISAMRC